MVEDLSKLPPVIDVERAGRILGLSRPTAYSAAHKWLNSAGAEGLPCIRIGARRMIVPTARLLAMLGLDADGVSKTGKPLQNEA